MYGNFISKLSDNYEVHIASSDTDKNNQLLNMKKSNQDSIGFVSHSTGVADLWNTYSSDNNCPVNTIVLIEPLDLQKGRPSLYNPTDTLIKKFNENLDTMKINNLNDKIEEIVETDYMELLKSNIFGVFKKSDTQTENKDKQETTDDNYCVVDTEDAENKQKERGKMLIVKHKQSDKWRFVPTVPPLSFLNYDVSNFDNFDIIDEVVIDKYSHFDILDRPWANLMNRASLSKIKILKNLTNI